MDTSAFIIIYKYLLVFRSIILFILSYLPAPTPRDVHCARLAFFPFHSFIVRERPIFFVFLNFVLKIIVHFPPISFVFWLNVRTILNRPFVNFSFVIKKRIVFNFSERSKSFFLNKNFVLSKKRYPSHIHLVFLLWIVKYILCFL